MNYYIYKIIHKETGKYYIGQRMSKCLPEDDKYYMGSGKHIKRAVKKYGRDAFIKIILDTAESIEDLDILEDKYIGDSYLLEECYNIKAGGAHGIHSDETKQKISEANSGSNNPMFGKSRIFSEEHKSRISKAITGSNNPMFGKKHSQDTKNKISKANSNPSDDTRRLMSEARLRQDNNGISKQCKDANLKAMIGKPKSDEQKRKMSESAKNKHKIKCPHCNRLLDPGNYKQWHGDKCKLKGTVRKRT